MNTTEQKTVSLPLKEGDREILEKMGLTVLPNKDNQFLTEAILPVSWYSKIYNHYWSYICDEKHRQRISVFIKCEIWDTRGYIDILTVFDAGKEYVGETEDCIGIVKKEGETIYQTEIVKQEKLSKERKEYASIIARQKAVEWLNKKYPDWENRLAYWD